MLPYIHTTTRLVNTQTFQEIDVVNSCGNRSCPICSKVRSQRLFSLYSPLFAVIEPSKLSLLTLTFPNTNTLSEGLFVLKNAVSHLRHQKLFKDKVKGGLASIEVTYNQGWHVHVHMLLYSDFLIRKKLIKSWFKLTGGYIVDVRQVKTEPLQALNYILKYVQKGLKFRGVPPEQVDDFYYIYNATMYRFRSFFSFGCFYGVKKEKSPDWESVDYLESLKKGVLFHKHSHSFSRFSDFLDELSYKESRGLTF